MLGDKIKKIRIERELTQNELAKKLYVTAQAVSRWENNEVEPSIATLTTMAGVLNVSVGELLGEEAKPVKVVTEKEYVYKEQKPVLAVCSQCNKPIYKGTDIVRTGGYNGVSFVERIICKTCHAQNEKKKLTEDISRGKKQRRKAFVRGSIYTLLILTVALICVLAAELSGGAVAGAIIGSLLFFPFLSCLYLKNNFVGEMVETIASWSVRFPGLIFSLDLDGIIWLITVKLTFWVLGAFISLCCFMLAVMLGLVVSIFVYPFALTKNIKHPELTDEI